MIKQNEKKYHYLYRITNTINFKIYIGVHSTNDLNDGYMGSGTILKKAKEKWGIKNFKMDILKFFDSTEEMLAAERDIVNPEFRDRKDTYNIAVGGGSGNTGMYDDYHRSMKLSESLSGRASMMDKHGNVVKVSCDDDYDTLELVGITKGHGVYKNVITGENIYTTTDDERIKSGELRGVTIGMVSVKDENGNTFSVRKDDERYLTGKLVGVTKGCKQTKESNLKRSIATKGIPRPQEKYKCPICGKITTKVNLRRWHIDCQSHYDTVEKFMFNLIRTN